MKLKWKKFGDEKPRTSGFYFVKHYKDIEIMYYMKTLDCFLYFEFEYDYLYKMPGYRIEESQWAKLVNIPKSELIKDGYLKLDT